MKREKKFSAIKKLVINLTWNHPYDKLRRDLSCLTTPVILYYCFHFFVDNLSWASRAWCIFGIEISGTKMSKLILALAFC